MKYCIKCGQQLSPGTKFCTRCGAEQTDDEATSTSQSATIDSQAPTDETTATDDVNQAQRVSTEKMANGDAEDNDGCGMTVIVIGFIILLLVGFFGVKGYQTYKRNHLTEQQLANIGGDVADDILGADEVTVYYSKENNELDLVANSGTTLYDRADDVVNGYASAGRLKSYVSDFEDISTEMSKKMPTDLRDVRVRFMNPENTDRSLYTTQDGEVKYDFTTDSDY